MHAILITAYKEPEQLKSLVTLLSNEFVVYVHVDKSSVDICEEDIVALNSMRNVKCLSKYKIVWGGYNHLLAILYLLEKCLLNKSITYVHTISAQDIPLKDLSYFKKLEVDDMAYMSLSTTDDFDNEVMARLNSIYVFPNAHNLFTKILYSATKVFSRFLMPKRNSIGEYAEIYKGMVWVSLPRDIAEFVNERRCMDKRFLRGLKYTYIPEEFFFQTVIMNSKYSNRVVRKNLRYTQWERRNGSLPAILDLSDYDRIVESNALFARKVDKRISFELLKKLNLYT